MNGGELSEIMMRVVERFEREPRFSLAWVLAYGVVLPRVRFLPLDEWPQAIAEAEAMLVDEIRKTNDLARSRRRARGFANLNDRIERLLRGEKLPDTRRRRRRKVV